MKCMNPIIWMTTMMVVASKLFCCCCCFTLYPKLCGLFRLWIVWHENWKSRKLKICKCRVIEVLNGKIRSNQTTNIFGWALLLLLMNNSLSLFFFCRSRFFLLLLFYTTKYNNWTWPCFGFQKVKRKNYLNIVITQSTH